MLDKIKRLLFAGAAIILLAHCAKDSLQPVPKDWRCYLFLGHTYSWQHTDKVDPRVERLNLDSFSEIWLGGDITAHTTEHFSTIQYLEDLFDLDSPNTHWALGNHDTRYGNVEWITQATGRNTYYAHYQNGITRLVLDYQQGHSQLYQDTCERMEAQLEYIQSVTDTISHSSHLIVMMHMVVWGNVESGMNTAASANAESSWIPWDCTGSKFKHAIYPHLLEVQKRGIDVMVISGDGGQKAKQYAYTTEEGMQFFISGINNSLKKEDAPQFHGIFSWNPDSVLVFYHDEGLRELNWEFRQLNEMIQQ